MKTRLKKVTQNDSYASETIFQNQPLKAQVSAYLRQN